MEVGDKVKVINTDLLSHGETGVVNSYIEYLTFNTLVDLDDGRVMVYKQSELEKI